MLLASLLLFSAIASPAGDASPQLPTGDEVVAKLMARDNERQAALHGYTVVRRYVLENQSYHKRAEMLVRMTCLKDGSKHFEMLEAAGWGGAPKHVFPRLLEAEADASQPGSRERSRITSENYAFEMLGVEHVGGREAYVIAVSPKTPNKYLLQGRIWVDADEYAIIRIDGKPAKNPSFWIKSVHFVHSYDKLGPSGSPSPTVP